MNHIMFTSACYQYANMSNPCQQELAIRLRAFYYKTQSSVLDLKVCLELFMETICFFVMTCLPEASVAMCLSIF